MMLDIVCCDDQVKTWRLLEEQCWHVQSCNHHHYALPCEPRTIWRTSSVVPTDLHAVLPDVSTATCDACGDDTTHVVVAASRDTH